VTDTPVDPFLLSPEQAAAKLAELSAAYRGPPADNEQARLDAFYSDPEKRQKLEAGDGATRREFDALAQAAAEADPTAAVMAGVLPEVPSSDLREMSELASYLRDLGMSESLVKETISNQETTQEIRDAAVNWEKQHLSNEEFVKRYLNGDIEARRLMTACAIVKTQPIGKSK